MNEREKQLLEAIIKYHIQEGESIASRTLEKKYGLGISSATIRNTMSDLEEIGLLKKNHISSGRIPTVEGYKAYLNELFKEKNTNYRNEVYKSLASQNFSLTEIYSKIAELISNFTNGLGFVVEHSLENENVSNVKLVYINEREVAAVTVINEKIVKWSTILLNTAVVPEMIDEMNAYLTKIVNISEKKEIKMDTITKFLESIGSISKNKDGQDSMSASNVYTSGLINLADFSKEALEYITNSSFILNNLSLIDDLDKNIVTFGQDIDSSILSDISIIYRTYEVINAKVTIGVIGPIRMDYDKVFAYLNSVQDVSEYIINMTKNKKRIE